MTNTSLARPAAALLAVVAFAACGGNGSPSTAPTPAPAPPAASAPAAAASSSMNNMSGMGGGLPSGVTVMMVAAGDSIYHARNCKNCHGADAKGAKNGPSLSSGTFMHISGSYDDIVKIITSGVPATEIKDPAHTIPMRPRGGGAPPMLTDDQVREVAAYVYSLNHK